MKIPYSYADAERLAKEYQHLTGSPFGSSDAVIESVSIVPFDHASRQRFFLYYLLFDGDAVAALTQEYKGLLYDIEVIAKSNEDELLHEDLFTWIKSNKTMYTHALAANQPAPSQVYL